MPSSFHGRSCRHLSESAGVGAVTVGPMSPGTSRSPAEAEAETSLRSLTPAYDEAEHGTYPRRLTPALTGKDRKLIRNIAVCKDLEAGRDML
jgi:hypothetical protein